MKKNGRDTASQIIDQTMHFLVHNGFMVTAGVMCLVHATLLFMMLAFGVTPLVQFNILSVTVYAFCFLLCRFGHIMPVYVSIILEVTCYTVISTYYLGLRCGTYCFLFSIVPIIIYFGTFLFKGWARWSVVLMLVINFGVFVYLYVSFYEARPVFELDPASRITLVFFSSFVMVFSTIFYNFLYIYASEVQVKSLEQRNEQLSADAREDALTGLLNRRGFMPLLEELMKRDDAHFCIAFCDIDNFKRINDANGHDAGDEVLRHITGMIKKEMHGCNICRWGGEEIVILMKDHDMTVALEKAEYLRKSVEASPTLFFNNRIFTTVTVGLEENKDSYREPDDIIKVADERMYYGKQHGKNIVVWENN
ncbi:MAG: GGDEF domain-containing protein [Lachnospiraceae bacterium]|nr:GGDEF domain-containing protein [Lachnospiraceae bacterium]